MDLPVAPPAFDATTGSRQRRRVDRGADIAAGGGLVLLELIALAMRVRVATTALGITAALLAVPACSTDTTPDTT
ncbi:hypothetical protein AB0I50_07065, partial [Streptomyces prunicolor]